MFDADEDAIAELSRLCEYHTDDVTTLSTALAAWVDRWAIQDARLLRVYLDSFDRRLSPYTGVDAVWLIDTIAAAAKTRAVEQKQAFERIRSGWEK
jgi:hypothetical protein